LVLVFIFSTLTIRATVAGGIATLACPPVAWASSLGAMPRRSAADKKKKDFDIAAIPYGLMMSV
jgi:hypothetical protein